jgi:hypothetical protein
MTYSIHWYACNPIDLGRQFASDPSLIDITIRKNKKDRHSMLHLFFGLVNSAD